MKQIVLFSFCIFLSISELSAQEADPVDIVSFGASYNTFLMQDLKEQSERILEDFPIENAEITNSFPPYFGYELNYRKGYYNKLSVGALAHYTSTGSRVTYSDFTGTLNVDQLLDYYSAGVIGSSVPINNEKFLLYIDLKVSIIYTNYKIKSYFQIGEESSTDDDTKFYAFGLGIQPGATFFYNFDKFKIGSNLGIEGNINGKLKVWGEEGYVVDSDNQPIKANWTGLRFGLIVAYKLQ